MKHSVLYAAALAFMCVFASSCQTKVETVIDVTELPSPAMSFVLNNFITEEIDVAVKDGDEYEVRFVNGWKVEFDNDGEWKDVDCNRDAVPASVMALLPESVSAYLKENFGNAFVTEIEAERSGYDIGLNNGTDVYFTSEGVFRKIDR